MLVLTAMANKNVTIYECESCGFQSPRWEGRCSQCGEWNTLKQLKINNSRLKSSTISSSTELELKDFSGIKGKDLKRFETGVEEFDRVVGGGIVPGSVTLVAGSPGIGKSTLILQVVDKLKLKTLYISGEESAEQVKNRSDRLGLKLANVRFSSASSVESLVNFMSKGEIDLIVVDSVQTMWAEEVDGIQGGISQVKASAGKLMEAAKAFNAAVMLIGHVTKQGTVAGPKTLEHIVDTVIYLEGDRYHDYRILRTSKNRFGSTNEVGIFEMLSTGFKEIKNPSEVFLKERGGNSEGSVVTATLEGTRAFLVEIQALTSLSTFGYPKRTASGIDLNRLALLSAVLTRRAGINLSNQDVYLNVVGGFRIGEPSVDLAAALAIASSFLQKPIPSDVVAFGEIGLSGEVRRVVKAGERIQEAKKLGFKKIICNENVKIPGIEVIRVRSVAEAIEKLGIKGIKK